MSGKTTLRIARAGGAVGAGGPAYSDYEIEAKEGLVKLREGEVIFPQGFDFEPYKNVQLTLTPTTATQPTRATQQSAPSASGANIMLSLE